jgi:hypothetical protein
MRFKFILPALTEAESPFWRPIKYSLFPPLGLATLAAYLDDGDDVQIIDQHVHKLDLTDRPDVFERTVDWAIERGITTATFHIATPYPDTGFFREMDDVGRILTRDWNLYDTRHVVFEPRGMMARELKAGYDSAYEQFYRWSAIIRSSLFHGTSKYKLKHFFYAGGWKKFEPLWNAVIQMRRLGFMTPLLEAILSRVPSAESRAEISTCGSASSAD